MTNSPDEQLEIREHENGLICIGGKPVVALIPTHILLSDAAGLIDYLIDAVYQFYEDKSMRSDDDTVH